jgi:hypothetical protein
MWLKGRRHRAKLTSLSSGARRTSSCATPWFVICTIRASIPRWSITLSSTVSLRQCFSCCSSCIACCNMCVRKVGYLVAEKRFVAIPLLPPPLLQQDKDATSKFVVEIQCSNRACRYSRQEMLMVQSLAQCARSCGNFSCFYPGCRVIPVLDPSPQLYRVIL